MSLNRFRKILDNRLKRLESAIAIEEKALEKAPDGRIRMIRSNGEERYYVVSDGEGNTGRYIGKKDISLITRLVQKSYDQKVLRAATKERDHLKRMIKYYPGTTFEEVIDTLNERRSELITPIILTDEEYRRQWENTPYTPKKIGDDVPLILTNRGERVRSKSEKIIADRLFERGIPYKYECPKRIKGLGTIHPDFTILKMSTREEVYLEHHGMMDDPQYVNVNINRFNHYAMDGVVIGKNLYLLFETYEMPLDTRVLNKIIDELL